MTIDLDLVKRIALLVVALVVSWAMAFKGTPDLNCNDRRIVYRIALMAFYLRGIMFMFEMFGWIITVR